MRNITIYIAILIAALSTTNTYAQVAFTESNLPIIVINTYGNTINNEKPVGSRMMVIFHEDGGKNYLADTSKIRALNYNGDITIKIRGHSSQLIDKKPYSIHTTLQSGDNNNVSLLGLPAENDWVLNNIAYDPSYIRDYISYGLSEQLGNYAPRCQYCEVVIDGDYKGLYILTEKMKANKNRIDIKKTDENSKNTDCGYIFEANRSINSTSWIDYPSNKFGSDSIMYSIKYPKKENISKNQLEFIQNFYRDFTEKVHSRNENIDNGFPSMIDIQSFVDFMLIGEFTSNADIYQYSTYFHKDIKAKLRAGPVWDFNLTFGNDIRKNRSQHDLWQFSNYTNEGAMFWKELFNCPTFRCHLSKRWHELTAAGQPLEYKSVCSFIDETVSTLTNAIQRDCIRWGKNDQHESNIGSMKEWIRKRIEWMNSNIGSCEQCKYENVPKLVISRINYNPRHAGPVSSDELEFIEITNNSDEQVNLAGIYFGGTGFNYVFPSNSSLMPNEKAIICSDSLQFIAHYGQIPFGQYARHLSNQSQRLVLYDAWGNLIDEVTYSCNPPWPKATNGQGSFLELNDLNSDNSIAKNWHSAKSISQTKHSRSGQK
ncbi:MAG: CotH kinase family protein [Bacteroidales bacterium]|nr:CotH kinase family protein [Bacteroidales bacterium]